MASRKSGNQPVLRNQRSALSVRSATMVCANRSRLELARANAATPRQVNGCQAGGSGRCEDFVPAVGAAVGLATSLAMARPHLVWVAPGLGLGGVTTTRLMGYRIFMTSSTSTST